MKLHSALIGLAALSLGASSSAQVYYTEGHADLAIGYDNGAWDLHVHDDTNGAEYEPGDVVFVAGLSSLTTRPASSSFDFIGVGAGQQYFRLRETPAAGQPFLGFSTEEIDSSFPGQSYTETDSRVVRTSGSTGTFVSVQITNVTGPGTFSIWQNDPDGNGPVVWVTTVDGISAQDRFVLLSGVHTHTNWGFTLPGDYEVTVQPRYWNGSAFVDGDSATYKFQAVPEPATLAALGLGALGLLRRRRK